MNPDFKSPPVPNSGRDTLYKPEYCELLITHMSKGLSLESFGALIGVHRNTLYLWRDNQPEFAEAIQLGREKSLYFYETLGIQGMAGKIKGWNNGTFALIMANKHKWTNRTDVTSQDEKIEGPVIFIPEEHD